MILTGSARGPDGGGEQPRSSHRSRSHNSLLVAASLVVTAMFGAAQAFALVVICGTDPRTEAFLVAYALYLPMAVLGGSLRATISSLASRTPALERADRAGEIVSRCIIFGAMAAAAMLALSPLIAPVLTSQLPASTRDTTVAALALLLPAALLHVVAAALSGVLGSQGHFRFSAGAYVASATLSLAVSIVMLSLIGPLGAGAGILAGTVLLAGSHLRRGRAAGIGITLTSKVLGERAQWQLAVEILTGAALGFALQANFAISLAALGEEPGAITAYSYAFFMATMILSLSSLPLALVTLPDLVGAVQQRGRAAVVDHLVRVAPFAYAVVLPLVAVYLGFARPIITWAFEPFAGAFTAQLLWEVGRSLVLMTVPATLFYLASAASLPATTPRQRLAATTATIALHAAAVALVFGDPRAVAWAHAAAMTLSTVFLLAQILGRLTLDAAMRALRQTVPVAIAACPIVLIGLVVGSTASVVTCMAGVSISLIIYALSLCRLAPAVAAPFISMVRRS